MLGIFNFQLLNEFLLFLAENQQKENGVLQQKALLFVKETKCNQFYIHLHCIITYL